MTTIETNAPEFNVNSAVVSKLVASTGLAYKKAALQNVAAIVLYGLTTGTGDASRRSCRDVLVNESLLAYSTAARQVSFGMGCALKVRKAIPAHDLVNAVRRAETGPEAMKAVNALLSYLGITSANEAALWAKGDGTSLTAEKAAELRAAPVKAEKEPKAEKVEPAPAPAPDMKAQLVAMSDDELAALMMAVNAEMKRRADAAAPAMAEAA